MATYSSHRLIMGKEEIGNFYCLIGDNRILFLQKCLLFIFVAISVFMDIFVAIYDDKSLVKINWITVFHFSVET